MYTHYAPMVSYYSAKTRACLGYKRIPFVEVYEPAAYRDRIAPALGRTVFPVLESDHGEILQDTTVIIDALEQRHPDRPVFPRDPVLMLVTRIVEFFVDELWVVTAMQTRWNDPDARRFVIAEFNRFFGQGDADDIWATGDAVAERMQSYLPALGLDQESGQRLILRLFEEATELLDQAVGPRQFAFGPHPSLADCCLYAAYYPHQYRDHGAAQAHLKTKAANLCYFLDNVHAAYGMPAEGRARPDGTVPRVPALHRAHRRRVCDERRTTGAARARGSRAGGGGGAGPDAGDRTLRRAVQALLHGVLGLEGAARAGGLRVPVRGGPGAGAMR